MPHSSARRRRACRYADVQAGGLEDRVKWCTVKSVRRAQEKVQRSYNEVCVSGRDCVWDLPTSESLASYHHHELDTKVHQIAGIP